VTTERIRSDERLAVTIAALIFGPLFILGPLAGGICMLVLEPLSVWSVLGAIPLCCLRAFLAYHMTQNYSPTT
jgi:hypothetical protein